MGSLLINLAHRSVRPTGLTTYAQNLVPHLRSLNPVVLSHRAIADLSCYPVPGNMTSDQGSWGHVRRLTWLQWRLPQLYRQLGAQLLFSPVPEAPLWAGCRFVVTVHDLIPLRFPRPMAPLTLYAQYYVPRVLAQAEHIISNSEATARDIVEFYGVAAHRITPIPLAHDAANFRFLDLPTRNYFLYLGRIDPYKNVQSLLTAFARLPQHRDYELWLAGPADARYRPVLEAQMAELGLTAQVKFLDYVPYAQLPVLLNQAIAMVFPTLWEGFGLPALEAMACGTPVITSNLASLPEVTGDAALLVDPRNADAIASAMHRLVSEPQLHAQLRAASLERAQQFSWAKTGAATAALLQQME